MIKLKDILPVEEYGKGQESMREVLQIPHERYHEIVMVVIGAFSCSKSTGEAMEFVDKYLQIENQNELTAVLISFGIAKQENDARVYLEANLERGALSLSQSHYQKRIDVIGYFKDKRGEVPPEIMKVLGEVEDSLIPARRKVTNPFKKKGYDWPKF